MRSSNQTSRLIRKTRNCSISTLIGFVVVATTSARSVQGTEVDGFTEPFRTIDVAAAEAGIITKLAVQEGDEVQAGQVLATLDKEVHLALLAIAEQAKEAQGRLESAVADLELRKDRLHKFEELRLAGHARQEEVDRARMELAVAEGQVKASREDLLIKDLEHKKIKAQLARRTVRSRISGVVTFIHKDEGEFVAPNDPDILTIVEIDRLLATFSILSPYARRYEVGQKVEIRFPNSRQKAKGTIEFVSPVTDAESGEVRVKLRIDNPDNRYRSGERCVIDISQAK